jgi:hypothetical protein
MPQRQRAIFEAEIAPRRARVFRVDIEIDVESRRVCHLAARFSVA